MSLQLFAHPFSSCCQKALIALYEHAMLFEFRMLGAEREKRWPLTPKARQVSLTAALRSAQLIKFSIAAWRA